MKYDFITIGGATEDINFYTDEGILIDNKKDPLRQELLAFEYGAKIKVDKTVYTFGGGAANAAVCLALLDFKVASIVAVGSDDRGKRVVENLRRHKVKIKFIQKAKGERTSFSFLLISPKHGNEHTVFSCRGANSHLKLTNYELKALDKTKWIYLTSLSGAVKDWKDNLEKIFRVKKVKIAWNPGGRQLAQGIKIMEKYLKNTEVLILNKDEAIELVLGAKSAKARSAEMKKKYKSCLANMDDLLEIVHGYGPRIVVITCGKLGAHVYDGENFYFQKPVKEKKRVDTTGVGDAFGSSFVAGLDIYSGDIQKAMKLAARNTASVIVEVGAQNGLIKI